VPLLKLFSLSLLVWMSARRATGHQLARAVCTGWSSSWTLVDARHLRRHLAGGAGANGKLASVSAGPGAMAFAAVVVLTMLAAQSFDPRSIWDPLEKMPESAAPPDLPRLACTAGVFRPWSGWSRSSQR